MPNNNDLDFAEAAQANPGTGDLRVITVKVGSNNSATPVFMKPSGTNALETNTIFFTNNFFDYAGSPTSPDWERDSSGKSKTLLKQIAELRGGGKFLQVPDDYYRGTKENAFLYLNTSFSDPVTKYYPLSDLADSVLSPTSTLPPQNKVVTEEFSKKNSLFQYDVLPPAENNQGKYVQYTGLTTATLQSSKWYHSEFNSGTAVWEWVQLQEAGDIWVGTTAPTDPRYSVWINPTADGTLLPFYKTVTLTQAGWNTSNEQTISIPDFDSTKMLPIPYPEGASAFDFFDNTVVIFAKSGNDITFKCKTVPTTDLSVNIQFTPNN